MKYIAVNELDNFEYHDAYIDKIEFLNGRMLWEVRDINATTENSQNGSDKHMCIENALMIFEDAKIEKIIFAACKISDANGVLIKHREDTPALPNEYNKILDDYFVIYGLNELTVIDNGKYRAHFDILGSHDYFYFTITFTESMIKWDNFGGKAWYEKAKDLRKQRERE